MSEFPHSESDKVSLNNSKQGSDFQFMNEKMHVGRNVNGGLKMANINVTESTKKCTVMWSQ